MKMRLIILCCISFLFIGWVCGNRDDGPTSPSTREVVLNNSTFEKNGLFTMDGWSLVEPDLHGLVDSSYDTPISSSLQALKLRRDTLTSNVPGVTKTLISSSADTTKKYFVSLYARGKGTLLMQQRTEDGPKSTLIYLDNLSWKYYTLTTVTPRPVRDTLTFTFRPLNIDPVPYLLIDNIQISYRKIN